MADATSAESISTHYARRQARRNAFAKSLIGRVIMEAVETCWLMLRPLERVILSLHTTKGDVNYEEVKQQFLANVLEDTKYYNDNINGKWYRKAEHIVEGRNYNEDFRL